MATAEVEDDNILAAAVSGLNTDSNLPYIAFVQNDDTPDCTNCPILALNQDCLLDIFSYLSMEDLLSVVKVCSQWKVVTDLSWRRFTTFDCTKLSPKYSDDTFKNCLIRCGPSLKKIYFPHLMQAETTSEFFSIIAKYCPNIEWVVLHFRKYCNKKIKVWSRLKCLEMDYRFNLNLLNLLFQKMSKSQLKHLIFGSLDKMKPHIIAEITHEGIGTVAANGKLKELVLISTMVTDRVISTVLANCYELKFLDLSACRGITEKAVQTLLGIFTLTNNRVKLTAIVGGTEYEEGADNLEDLFATNLVILSSTNNFRLMFLGYYKGTFL